MTSTVRLGRIAGVAVRVHWSVLAIVVLGPRDAVGRIA
jgi:hypothetical protein